MQTDGLQGSAELINLITNSLKAVSKNRDVIFLSIKTVFPADIPAVHRFPIDWRPQDNAYACMEVTDKGSGTVDNDIEKLFDLFFTNKFIGRGSTFLVFFPVSSKEVLPKPDKAATCPQFDGGGMVLLVENDDKLRNMASAMLKRLGFKVLETNDGVAAVETFGKHKDQIRLVLAELTMPRMNGWKILTVLRKLVPGVPVILSSSYDEAHVMSGDHPELPQAFLCKPYVLKGLSEAIGQQEEINHIVEKILDSPITLHRDGL